MAKGFDEIASEIVQEVVRARGQALSGVSQGGVQDALVWKYLSDDAITELYRKVLRTLKETYNS